MNNDLFEEYEVARKNLVRAKFIHKESQSGYFVKEAADRIAEIGNRKAKEEFNTLLVDVIKRGTRLPKAPVEFTSYRFDYNNLYGVQSSFVKSYIVYIHDNNEYNYITEAKREEKVKAERNYIKAEAEFNKISAMLAKQLRINK